MEEDITINLKKMCTLYFAMYRLSKVCCATFNTFSFACKDWNFPSAKFVSKTPKASRLLDYSAATVSPPTIGSIGSNLRNRIIVTLIPYISCNREIHFWYFVTISGGYGALFAGSGRVNGDTHQMLDITLMNSDHWIRWLVGQPWSEMGIHDESTLKIIHWVRLK